MKYIFATLGAALSPLFFWLAGFNFDSRGYQSVFCVVFALIFFVISSYVYKLSNK